MRRSEIALWVVAGLLGVALGIVAALLYGEIAALRVQVEVLAGARPAEPASWGSPALPTPPSNSGVAEVWGSRLEVTVVTATVPLSHTTAITLDVRGSGSADLLLDLPVLVCAGGVYPVDGAALETARRELLGLITRGASRITLSFDGAGEECRVLFNAQQPADSIVAPRLEAPVMSR